MSHSKQEKQLHKCYFCSTVSLCCANKCECFHFGREIFCNEGCKDDYLVEVQYKSMVVKEVIACDLHIYFDLETTGLDSDRNEVIELGAAVDPLWLSNSNKSDMISMMDDEKEKEKLSFNVLIKPQKGLKAEAMKINGITQDIINKHAVSMDEAMTKFFDWVKSMINQEPAVVYMTAYNAHGFDGEFLRKSVLKSNVEVPGFIHFTLCDSMKAVKEVIHKPFSRESMKLEHVYNRMVNPEKEKVQTHRALDDALMQIDIVKAFDKKQRKKYYDTLRQSSRIIEFHEETKISTGSKRKVDVKT